MGVAESGRSDRAGAVANVRLTISVPDAVKPGGYWCALSVDEVPDPLATTPDGVGVDSASVSPASTLVDPIERGADVLAARRGRRSGDRAPDQYRQHAAHG